MTRHFAHQPLHVVAFAGNTHRPSRSRSLASTIAARLDGKIGVRITLLDVVDAGPGLGAAFKREDLTPEALAVVEAIEQADALIAVTPVYKGSYTGLFKHAFDFVDPSEMLQKPVIVGAAGGGHRHALVVEHQMRPLFGFFSALTVPTSVYASDEEFRDGNPFAPNLLDRIDLAAEQLVALLSHAKGAPPFTAARKIGAATAA